MSLFLDLARARYSCRSFSEKPVERAKIDAIVQAGICAPTCVNRQPWHAWVITSADGLARAYASTRPLLSLLACIRGMAGCAALMVTTLST